MHCPPFAARFYCCGPETPPGGQFCETIGAVISTEASLAGLTSAEAARRLTQYGPNDPAPKRQRSQIVELLLQFANPLVAILLLASIVSGFVGEFVNAAIIIVIVC